MTSTAKMTGADRRAQLLVAARAAFIERGFRGVTTSDVAVAVGVSDALVLKHFHSKEHLFREAMADPLLRLVEVQLEANRGRIQRGDRTDGARAATDIADFLRSWASIVREERPAWLSLLADLRHFPDVEDRLFTIVRDHIEDLATTLESGTGDYAAFDPRVATWASVAAATAAGLLDDGGGDAFVNAYVDILMRGVLRRD